MGELTNLESKLAEVLGLASAAMGAAEKVNSMLDDDQKDLASLLERMSDQASETEQRCTEVAGEFDGKKTAILELARETKQEATEMMETYLKGEDEALDGFEFLTMAEAGEVGHWSIVKKFNERAGNTAVYELRSSARSHGGSSFQPCCSRERFSVRSEVYSTTGRVGRSAS
jgi:hypothetical protein